MIEMVRAVLCLQTKVNGGNDGIVAEPIPGAIGQAGMPITSPTATYTHSAVTVTNASQQFLTANSSRRYLLIQNRDVTGNIFMRFGAAATTATGIQIAPGANYEIDTAVSGQTVNIIGDIASNANVLIVEGV